MPWLLSLSLFTLVLSSCVTIKDNAVCAALPRIIDGGGCGHLRSATTFELTRKELLDLIDTQPAERKCVPVGHFAILNNVQTWVQDLPVCAEDQSIGTVATLSARGASMIMADDAWNEMKTELETACRELGSRCSVETKTLIQNMEKVASVAQRQSTP